MPRWKVERALRTASPTAVGASGGPALVPSRRPGAHRRPTPRPILRWGLRALVVGGLAGAAWLLTGAAAQAADHDPTVGGSALGSSLTGVALPGGTTEPAVAGILQAATQPLDSDQPTLRNHRPASALDLPAPALAEPMATTAGPIGEAAQQERVTDVDPAVGDVADSAVGEVEQVVPEITGILRLTGGTVDSRLAGTAPVTASLVPGAHGVRTVRPVIAPLPTAVAVAATVGRTEAPKAPKASQAVAPAVGAAAGSVSRHHPVVTDRATGNRRPSVRRAVVPETIRKASGGERPLPLQVRLGVVGGLATSGSPTPTDGASAAFLPAAVAASTVAFHRMPVPADAEIRRYDAEAPTVSPD
jgi:hypothetical protein